MLDALHLDPPGGGGRRIVIEQGVEMGVFGPRAAEIVPGGQGQLGDLGLAAIREGVPEIVEGGPVRRQKRTDEPRQPGPRGRGPPGTEPGTRTIIGSPARRERRR
jgi:hypothetical protein